MKWLKNKITWLLIAVGFLTVAYGQTVSTCSIRSGAELKTPYTISSRSDVNKECKSDRIDLLTGDGGGVVIKKESGNLYATLIMYDERGREVSRASNVPISDGVTPMAINHCPSSPCDPNANKQIEVIFTTDGRATYEARIMSQRELKQYDDYAELFN